MNVISYNDKDLQTLYNKYRMSSYYPNESMKSNINQPQYVPLNNHNLLLNTSLNINNIPNGMNNPLDNKNEYLLNIKPIPNIRERNRQKLLQESDKVFDDLEMYGLILTNDLLKIRRLQQKINKNDFTLEYNSFRKRLYTNIDTAGEKMVNSIKNITAEFESINESILSYFKRVLNRNTEFSSKLEFPLNNLKESTNNKALKLDKLFKQRADQLKTLKYFLYPPKIVTGIEIPDELKINWDERYERLKHLNAYRKLNNDLQQKIKFSKDRMNLMNKAAILEERETIREIEDKEEKLKKKEEEEKRKNEEEEKRRKEEDEKRKKEEDKNKEGEEKRKKEVKEDKKKEDEEKRKREQKAKEKKEDEEKKIKIMEDIHNYEKLLKKITFRIEQIDKEIDGLFFTSKEIILENTIGDKLKIPQEKAIIVEVKNINKYKTMVENIRIKKKLMSTLGFKTEDLFFVGILRGIDVDGDKKKEINDKYYKELNMQNMIVIYAEKFNFLNVPLIQVKNEKKEKPKEDANLYSMIMDLKTMLINQSNDINELKKDVNLLKEKIK